ncbi:hypothetical protein ABMA75_10975 [Halobacteriovorax sp. ZH4_bin.1]|uniref:hypothetical protein n=1 Tax=unclassified Halobacteriovorax TaxID=2639665 RepID=UPI003719E6EC
MSENTMTNTNYDIKTLLGSTQELIAFLESHSIENEESLLSHNLYIDSILKILLFHTNGKVQKLSIEINNLIGYLLKRKKINRLNELKNILNHFSVSYSQNFDSYISVLNTEKVDETFSNSISTISTVKNSEKYFQYATLRKKLERDIELIDPLMFIESIFKVIPLFFETSEHKSIIYKYGKNSDDNDLIRAINYYLKDFDDISEFVRAAPKRTLDREYIEAYETTLNKKDELLSLVELRERLVDGCESKDEYINTLFEMAVAYRKLGNKERAYFLAIIVNRIYPGYRNVEVMLKR